MKNYQAWNDEQIPVFDCLEKLRGYKYVVVLDIDEYLIPKSTKSWMELFVSGQYKSLESCYSKFCEIFKFSFPKCLHFDWLCLYVLFVLLFRRYNVHKLWKSII